MDVHILLRHASVHGFTCAITLSKYASIFSPLLQGLISRLAVFMKGTYSSEN